MKHAMARIRRGWVLTFVGAIAASALVACGGGDIQESSTAGSGDCGDFNIAVNPWVGYEADAYVVGTVAVWRPGAPGSEAWLPEACDLRHLAVHPTAQGRGLSKPLLDEAERRARQMGAKYLCLHVRRGNRGVAKLYMDRGYIRAPEGDLELPEVLLDAYYLPLR